MACSLQCHLKELKTRKCLCNFFTCKLQRNTMCWLLPNPFMAIGHNILGLLNAPALHLKLYFMRTSVQYILLIHEEKSWPVSWKDEAVQLGVGRGDGVLILTLDCTGDCKVKCILYYLYFSNVHCCTFKTQFYENIRANIFCWYTKKSHDLSPEKTKL